MSINPWAGFQQGTNQLINVLAMKRQEEQDRRQNELARQTYKLAAEKVNREKQTEKRTLAGQFIIGVKDPTSYEKARQAWLSIYPEDMAVIPPDYNPQFVEGMKRAYGPKPAELLKPIGAGGLYDVETGRTIPPVVEPPKPTTAKWSAPKSGIDEAGKSIFFQTDEEGNVRLLGGVTPEPKKGMKIYDRDGNLIVDTSGGAPGDVAPATRAAFQKEIKTSIEQLGRIKAVGELFSRDYLTWYGKAKGQGLRLMSFAGMELSPEQKEFLAGKRTFIEGVEQLFNIYRKDITGAQAVMKELVMLRDSILNKNLAPDEFAASFNRFISDGERALRIKMDLLEKGFSKEIIGAEIDRIMKGEKEAQPEKLTIPEVAAAPATRVPEPMTEIEARARLKSMGKSPTEIKEAIKIYKRYGAVK